MSYEAIGRRYARAIFDIGKEEGQVAALSEDLQRFAATWVSSAELQTVLENPLVAGETIRAPANPLPRMSILTVATE